LLSRLYHEGNTEEKNNGYVVLNEKNIHGSASDGGGGGGVGGVTEEGISKN
jgi:hypothetical protein